MAAHFCVPHMQAQNFYRSPEEEGNRISSLLSEQDKLITDAMVLTGSQKG